MESFKDPFYDALVKSGVKFSDWSCDHPSCRYFKSSGNIPSTRTCKSTTCCRAVHSNKCRRFTRCDERLVQDQSSGHSDGCDYLADVYNRNHKSISFIHKGDVK